MKFTNLYCIVGPSGVGKTTLANELSQSLHMRQVPSYTTRAPRYDGETGHIFVTPDEFHKLGEMCAYTKRNGIEYGVTADLLDQCQIYVIDPPGVNYLTSHYANRNVKVIGLYADPIDLRMRMRRRGDDEIAVEKRLEIDAKEISLESILDIADIIIPASGPISEIVKMAKAFVLGCELEDWIAM